jgi:hypothetical protein
VSLWKCGPSCAVTPVNCNVVIVREGLKYSNKNIPECCFIHQKPHTECSGVNLRNRFDYYLSTNRLHIIDTIVPSTLWLGHAMHKSNGSYSLVAHAVVV